MLRSVLALLLPGTVVLAQSILPTPPIPAGNPQTPDKALLGKALFWDEQMSSSRSVACGTCHIFSQGGTDPRASNTMNPGPDGMFGTDDDTNGSSGVVQHTADGALVANPAFGLQTQVTPRRAPSAINAAYARSLFLDGRADGEFRDPVSGAIVLPTGGALESQIAGPPVSSVEMGHLGRTWTDIATELPAMTPLALATNVPASLQTFVAGQTYDTLFTQVFGSPGVTPVRIIFAIAAYERTLISDQSPFDHYLAGQGTLTSLQSLGLTRFQTFCAACHTDLSTTVLAIGPVLDDFRNIGVRPPSEDLGRSVVTSSFADRGKFRVPGLRNVALRGSYFHNGHLQNLGEVIDFYARGGDFAENRDPLVDAINGHILIADNLQLQALLNMLTDPRVANELPPFDRPRLWSEGPLVPVAFGAGTGGTVAMPPRISALGPAHLGNAAFGVGMDQVAPNLFSVLLLDLQGTAVPTPVVGHNLYLGWSPALQVMPTGFTSGASGHGYTSAVFHIPNNGALTGDYWLQWLAIDPQGPSSFVSSNALQFTVF
jgi:cytochrome c peroxidase